ncbi:MAG: ThiF family adenylyltransferase [Patescibacteria group bacterium]
MEKPRIFNTKEDIPQTAKIIDAFSSGVEELFFANNPRFKKSMPEAKEPLDDFLKNHGIKDIWIYYPARDIAVRCLPEDLYFKLRTARNRNIITQDEQINYRNTKVGVVGLSVGSAVLSALVMSGGPKVLKIADFDTVEISNLNRINATLLDIGADKTAVAAREIWELDPFADLHLYPSGVSDDNLTVFITGEPKLDIFIDEMDSVEMKARARLVCRENKIPVLMATDNGDDVLLDVERYDLEPERPIFHGLVEEKEVMNAKNLNYQQWVELATKIVDPKYLPESMRQSLSEIGKTIAAIPQLGPTASVAGTAIAYAVRRIVNNQTMPSGRYVVSLEKCLGQDLRA